MQTIEKSDDDKFNERDFWYRWPEAYKALYHYHKHFAPCAHTKVVTLQEQWIKIGFSQHPSDIQAFCYDFFDLDNRSLRLIHKAHTTRKISDCYAWSVYSLVYHVNDEDLVDTLLNIFTPLCGVYAKRIFDTDFQQRIHDTFRGYVWSWLMHFAQYQQNEKKQKPLFLWLEQETDASYEQRSLWLEKANLPLLSDEYLSSNWIYNPFCLSRQYDIGETHYFRHSKKVS